jgi:signal transduction histidine kinase
VARSAPPQVADPVLPGRLAELLADHGEAGLGEALDLLVTELGLRSAVLRDLVPAGRDGAAATRGAGPLRAVSGEAVHAVPSMRVVPAAEPSGATVELSVRAGGRDAGVLTVVGARPSQLPVLRAAAAVLGLALSRPARSASSDAAADLVAAADAEADAAADLLHDGPVQALVVAHYAAEAAARGGDPALAREAVQAALVELRRSLWHLRPRGPADGGLPGALGALSARLEEAGRPPLGFVLDELLAAAMPGAVVSTAYRMVQAMALPEGADPVRVALRREGAAIVLDVEGGAPLPDPDRWANKARALGGSLVTSEGRTRLAVPLSTHSAPPSAPRTKATS